MSAREIVPPTWEAVPLSDVATVIQGQSPPGATYNTDGKGLPFFQGKAEFTDLSPVATKWCSQPTKIAEPGDVLISVRAPVGPTNLANVECCIGRGLAAIRLLGGIPSKFFLYYLRYSESDIASKGIGTTFSAITGDDLKNHVVLIPPLREQLRIVAVIETHLTRLDDAMAALERARAKLRRYRASVLKAAVEGRLVPTEAELARKEGREFEPASVLLDRILTERRRRWEESELARMKAEDKPPKDDRWKSKYKEPVAPGISTLPNVPEGWCWATLDQLIYKPLLNGRSVPTEPNGFPVLRLTALKGNAIDLSERKGGAWTIKAARPFLVAKDDFLVARGNGSIRLVGWGGLVDRQPDAVAFPDTLIRVCLAQGSVLPKLFAYIWNSRFVRDQIESKAKTTAGIHKINQADMSRFVVPLPPEREQRRILSALESTISVALAIEEIAKANESRCSRLRQSILRWSFEGKLANQDPNDEPASVLLERIQAERAAGTSSRKIHKPAELDAQAAK